MSSSLTCGRCAALGCPVTSWACFPCLPRTPRPGAGSFCPSPAHPAARMGACGSKQHEAGHDEQAAPRRTSKPTAHTEAEASPPPAKAASSEAAHDVSVTRQTVDTADVVLIPAPIQLPVGLQPPVNALIRQTSTKRSTGEETPLRGAAISKVRHQPESRETCDSIKQPRDWWRTVECICCPSDVSCVRVCGVVSACEPDVRGWRCRQPWSPRRSAAHGECDEFGCDRHGGGSVQLLGGQDDRRI